jgi:anthranilate synthase/aminodeoxychorismate synthase-like glutamine amidotransferase
MRWWHRYDRMILLIDNYDSFVHNLARYVRELGEDSVVRRNDQVTVEEIQALGPSHIIISPGPCSPAKAGISTELVQRFGPSIPILGVCLGHQCIGAAYGGDIVRAGRPRHGMTSPIRHDGTSIFDGLPSPFRVTRYHSLVIARGSLPSELRVTASAGDDGEIMAVEHRTFPVVGVQFHPESAATEYGYAMLDRFLHGPSAMAGRLPTGADGGESVHRTPDTPPPWGSRWDETGDSFVPPPVDLVR